MTARALVFAVLCYKINDIKSSDIVLSPLSAPSSPVHAASRLSRTLRGPHQAVSNAPAPSLSMAYPKTCGPFTACAAATRLLTPIHHPNTAHPTASARPNHVAATPTTSPLPPRRRPRPHSVTTPLTPSAPPPLRRRRPHPFTAPSTSSPFRPLRRGSPYPVSAAYTASPPPPPRHLPRYPVAAAKTPSPRLHLVVAALTAPPPPAQRRRRNHRVRTALTALKTPAPRCRRTHHVAAERTASPPSPPHRGSAAPPYRGSPQLVAVAYLLKSWDIGPGSPPDWSAFTWRIELTCSSLFGRLLPSCISVLSVIVSILVVIRSL